MKLIIFGATGRTGIPLVEQALSEGHQVKAFVRTPKKMPLKHDRLQLVEGDVLDEEAVEKAVKGTDAVLCVLGHTKGSPEDLQTRAWHHIVAAMKKHKVGRVVDLTGAGVRDPEDEPKLFDKLVVGALKLMAPGVLKDGKAHVEVIRESGLDWTIVRAPMLSDGPHRGSYRVGLVGKNSGSKINRSDVADFMLKEMTERKYVGKLPMISY